MTRQILKYLLPLLCGTALISCYGIEEEHYRELTPVTVSGVDEVIYAKATETLRLDGIRIESELLCRKGVKNEFGQFMYFQNLTCAPIDLDAIDVNALTVTERRWLNEYHAAVYETVAPHLTEDERVWLRDVTRAI